MKTIVKGIVKLYLLILLMLLAGCDSQKDHKRPNFIFIYTDDQSFETIAALGNEEIITPHMDKLVYEGTTFTHAYNMGGWQGAICVASRSMLLSGKSLWRAQQEKFRWSDGNSQSIDRSWPRLMTDAGYDTYMTGKWHVRLPADSVFSEVKGKRPGGMPASHWQGKNVSMHGPYWAPDEMYEAWQNGESVNTFMPKGYGRPIDENDSSWSPSDTTEIGYWDGGQHWSEALRDRAIEFLESASRDDDPFFMYLAFNAPHDPRQAPQEYIDMYPVDEIKIPENFMPQYPYKDAIQNSILLRDEALAPMPRTPYSIRKNRQEYYAMITHLDDQIGMILEKADELDQLESTYIIFTSDHGLSVGHHGLLGKQNMFDHSMRVPFIINGPNIPKDKKIDHDIYLQDVVPTVLELAEIQIPDHIEYQSIVGHLSGKAESKPYSAIYGAYVSSQRMIRKDGFKLLAYPNAKKLLLFDMKNDPFEIKDLSEQVEYNSKVRQLFADLVMLQKELDDPLDLTQIFNEYL